MKYFKNRYYKIRILFTVFMSIMARDAFAHDFEVDGMYFNIVSISEKTCEVTYRGPDYYDARFTYSGDITVPEFVQYNGRTLKVVGIGDYAFDNYDWWNQNPRKEVVTSISLPNSIEYLGKSSLAYNTFSEFRVPPSLKKVGYAAFNYYVSGGVKRIYVNDLKAWCEIEFETSSSSPFCHGERTDLGLFTSKGELYLNNELCEVITIPNEIKKINNYAFAGVASIKEIVLPEGIESIGDFAFCDCINLMSIKIPSTCKKIGKHAFNGCSQLSEVELSEGLKSIGDGAFSYCVSLQSLIFPSTINAIGKYMFYGMDLPHLLITKSATPLYCPESSLFNIKSIDFQREFTCRYWWSGTTEKIVSPFEDGYRYNKLKTVTIGPNVKELHRLVFEGCILDSVVLQNSDTPLLLGYSREQYMFKGTHYQAESVFADKYIKVLYLGRPIEVNYVELYQGVTERRYEIRSFFNNNTSFREISIGNSVSDISFLDFKKYKNLSSVTFGSAIETIPNLTPNDKLDSIVVVNSNPPSAISFANTTYLHGKLFVPKGCKVAYQSAEVWKDFWDIRELDQDFNTLGMQPLNMTSESKGIIPYAIDGIELSSPKRGVNIIKMADGTVKKVLVK